LKPKRPRWKEQESESKTKPADWQKKRPSLSRKKKPEKLKRSEARKRKPDASAKRRKKKVAKPKPHAWLKSVIAVIVKQTGAHVRQEPWTMHLVEVTNTRLRPEEDKAVVIQAAVSEAEAIQVAVDMRVDPEVIVAVIVEVIVEVIAEVIVEVIAEADMETETVMVATEIAEADMATEVAVAVVMATETEVATEVAVVMATETEVATKVATETEVAKEVAVVETGAGAAKCAACASIKLVIPIILELFICDRCILFLSVFENNNKRIMLCAGFYCENRIRLGITTSCSSLNCRCTAQSCCGGLAECPMNTYYSV
jgi:hypothetical protein